MILTTVLSVFTVITTATLAAESAASSVSMVMSSSTHASKVHSSAAKPSHTHTHHSGSNSSSATNSTSSASNSTTSGNAPKILWPTSNDTWSLNGTAYVRFSPLPGQDLQFVLKNDNDPTLLTSGNSKYPDLKPYLNINKDDTDALDVTQQSQYMEAKWFPIGGNKTKGSVKSGLGYNVGVAYRSNSTFASDTTTKWTVVWSDGFDIVGDSPDHLPDGVTPFSANQFKSAGANFYPATILAVLLVAATLFLVG